MKDFDYRNTFCNVWPLFGVTLRDVCHIVEPSVISSTSEKIILKSTHACFPHTHTYTRICVGLSVFLPTYELVKKFAYASFFIILWPAVICQRIHHNKVMSAFEIWKFLTKFTTCCTRKSKMSNLNTTQTLLLFKHVFLCFEGCISYGKSILRVVYLMIKSSIFNPINKNITSKMGHVFVLSTL